jgi:hypothetical protein
MRGTAANEPVVSQAATPAFREGHDRVFGDRPVQRGKWVFDTRIMKMVPADEYVPPHENHGLMVMTDRYYEGTVSPIDGSDIGSRRKRREHMKEHGLVDHDDAKSEARIVQQEFQRRTDRERHEALGRAIYEVTERRRQRK